jgi:hypothetical protein
MTTEMLTRYTVILDLLLELSSRESESMSNFNSVIMAIELIPFGYAYFQELSVKMSGHEA